MATSASPLPKLQMMLYQMLWKEVRRRWQRSTQRTGCDDAA